MLCFSLKICKELPNLNNIETFIEGIETNIQHPFFGGKAKVSLTERQTDRKTGRKRLRETVRDMKKEAERDSERQRETERHRETE